VPSRRVGSTPTFPIQQKIRKTLGLVTGPF